MPLLTSSTEMSGQFEGGWRLGAWSNHTISLNATGRDSGANPTACLVEDGGNAQEHPEARAA